MPSSFTAPLTVTKLPSGDWEVSRPFSYAIGSEDSDELIDIPEGFVTDFASVPRIFQGLIPKDGEWTAAAVVHDFLYEKRGKVGDRLYSRKRCDEIFLEAMGVLGVNWITRHTMYQAVRVGGWVYWNKPLKEKGQS